jgi:hypothetical protein
MCCWHNLHVRAKASQLGLRLSLDHTYKVLSNLTAYAATRADRDRGDK